MPKTLLPLFAVLLVASCTPTSESAKVARAFIRVPSHYVGNITEADRKFFVKETLGRLKRIKESPELAPSNVYQGRNLDFSWDGEEPMSGEGPLTFHLFAASSGKPMVGIFIERWRRGAHTNAPRTSLYFLSSSGSRWLDVTRQVLPEPFLTRAYYDFSPSSDTLRVRSYVHSPQGFIIPGRVLSTWRWRGDQFYPASHL